LASTNEIRQDLLERFPQVKEVEIKKGYPDTLNLAITERKEIGIFCQENKCFLLDHEGVIFEPASAESLLLRFQNQTLSGETALGSKVINKDILNSISEIVSKLSQNLKVALNEVSIMSEEEIDIKTSEGWKIYFNPKRDLNWQLTELTAVLENRIPPDKRKNLKYIDLRFDKVYIFPETYAQ
jgi:cell division septal protein FtsQ